MQTSEKVSDTTLLNFMLSDRIECRVISYNTPVFIAEKGLDTVYGKSPREALRGLYILRRKNNDDNE
jgi:hypothetical protein